MWIASQKHNWLPNTCNSRASWPKHNGRREPHKPKPNDCEWPLMNSNLAAHRARRPLALDRPMFEKLMTNPHADLGGYQCAVRFVNALVCMSEIEPLDVIWRLVSPSQFGLQRLRQILMISQVNLFTNDNIEIVNTLVVPIMKSIVNTPARYDPAARTSLHTLVSAIWAVPFLMQRLLEAVNVGKLEDTESLVLFLLCSVYLDAVKSDQTDHWNHLQKLVESLLHQGVSKAERISSLIQCKPGDNGPNNLSLCAIENQPGGRHGNDFFDFKRIQITPIPDEVDLSKNSDNTFLPMANGEDGFLINDPALRMVDRSFRLLREDMVSMLRDNLSKTSPIIFSNVCVDEFELRPQPCANISFDAPVAVQKMSSSQKKEFWRKSRWLSIGSLVCIAKDRQPIVFGEVIHRQFASERNYDWNDRKGEPIDMGDEDVDDAAEKRYVVGIAVQSESSFKLLANIQFSDSEFELLQGCFNFFSYKPALEALQCSSDFPFYQFLVTPSKIDLSSFSIDIDSISSLLKNFGGSIYEKSLFLDDAQRHALAFGVNSDEKLSLIQGPPGTGKTLIGVLIALALSAKPFTRILCICYTNHQLDQFLEALLDAGLTDIIRIGGRCSSDRLAKYVLSHRAGRARPPTLEGHYRWRLHDVYQLLKELENDIEELTAIISRPIIDWPFFDAHLDPEMTSQFYLEDFGDDSFELGYDGQVIKSCADLWRNWRLGHLTTNLSRCKYFLWTLNHQERLALLKTWQEELRSEQISILAAKFVQYKQLLEERISINQKNELPILMKAKVIGCTATGAAKYRALLNDVKCDIMIVEEAAELLEANVLGAINVYTEKIVMIGDHMQLRPKINNHRLSVESENGLDLNRSTFERLIIEGHPYVMLRTQHRMRPELSDVVRRITYQDLLDGDSVMNYPPLKGLKNDLIFVNHLGLERTEKTLSTNSRLVKSTSKINPLEAKLVVGTALYLCQQGYRADQIVILTPYLGQLLEIREVLSRAKIDVILGESDQSALDEVCFDSGTTMSSRSARRSEHHCSIRVSTVDNFQGQQADIVLVSLVRNNPNGRIGFLKQPERINVLLTRSRHGLILFGNQSCLTDTCPIWEKILESFRVTDGIPVICLRHDVEMLVRDHVDFVTLTPHGGCSNICEAELPCGHRCQSPCHDPAIIPHAKCSVRFPDKCPDGHKIMRPCREGRLPKCRQQVIDVCPECNMQIVRKCYVPIYEANCFNCEIEANRKRALLQIETEKVNKFSAMMEEQAKKLLDIEMDNARMVSDVEIKKTEQNADILLHKALADKKKAELDAIQTCQKIASDVACEIRKCHEDAERRRLDEQSRIDRLVREAQRTSATLKAAHEAIIQHSQEVALEEVATLEADRDQEAARIRETLRLAEDLRNMSMNVSCGICFEDYKRSDCVGCPSIDTRPNELHFFCRECFGQLVIHESDGDIRTLSLHGGMIVCPYARAAECVSPAFSDATIAKWVSAAVFEQYMKSKEKVLEKAINDEFEQNFPARLELEIKRRAEEAPVLVRRKIIEFLTPACPRCHAAFIDFDGCAALTCHNCPCRFCAFCLHDCGDDAHVHVASCKFNPTANVYVSVEVWKDLHRRWIHEQIVAVLHSLSYSQIPQTLKDCEKELIDLGIDPQTLVAALKVHKYSQ